MFTGVFYTDFRLIPFDFRGCTSSEPSNPGKKNPAKGEHAGFFNKYPILRTGSSNARSGRERVSTASAQKI
jgi:hypothetical protein